MLDSNGMIQTLFDYFTGGSSFVTIIILYIYYILDVADAEGEHVHARVQRLAICCNKSWIGIHHRCTK
jgi:hypothetical protein